MEALVSLWKKKISANAYLLVVGLGLAISRKLCKMMKGDMVRDTESKISKHLATFDS